MQFRKRRCMVICLLMVMILSGCSPIVKDIPQTFDVYATFYPLYALTLRIAEGVDDVNVHCLVQPQDDCLRTYDLSDWDLYMLGYSADAVISAGNGLEAFESKLQAMGENLVPVAEVFLGVHMEQFAVVQSDDDSHFSGDNPHVYMSVGNMEAILDNITGALSILNSENADKYEANRQEVQTELDELQSDIDKQTEVCNGIKAAVMNETLLYPALECGLDIAAVFERESGEALYEKGLTQCLAELEEKDIELVLLEQCAPESLIEALSEAGLTVVQLENLSTHREKDGTDGYFEAIKGNAQMIFDACANLKSEHGGQ